MFTNVRGAARVALGNSPPGVGERFKPGATSPNPDVETVNFGLRIVPITGPAYQTGNASAFPSPRFEMLSSIWGCDSKWTKNNVRVRRKRGWSCQISQATEFSVDLF